LVLVQDFDPRDANWTTPGREIMIASVVCEAGKPIGVPSDTSLPYVAYGLFKPNEFAFLQIEEFLATAAVPVVLDGSLRTRDGLPLLELGSGRTEGFRLVFRSDVADQAYAAIGAFEPDSHYSWQKTEVGGTMANVLVGRRLDHGSIELDESSWTYRTDPVLHYVPKVVAKGLRDDGAEFVSAPSESFDWERLFRLEMHYVLLWTLLERFVALRSGPLLEPGQKLTRLGTYPEFQAAFRRRLTTIEGRRGAAVIYDSRDPAKKERLDPSDAGRSVKYYYLVRSNVAHRGKGAWKDGEIVRCSLEELLDITVDMLRAIGIEPRMDLD
jgi:hypothetical protein